jgi:hypothetical protein
VSTLVGFWGVFDISPFKFGVLIFLGLELSPSSFGIPFNTHSSNAKRKTPLITIPNTLLRLSPSHPKFVTGSHQPQPNPTTAKPTADYTAIPPSHSIIHYIQCLQKA